jgi:hypothetical protein
VCAGTATCIITSEAINWSFLYLFGMLFVDRYKQPAKAGSKTKKEN